MDKILINLYVPILEVNYEVMVPDFLPLREVRKLVGKVIEDLAGGKYISTGEEILFMQSNNMIFRDDCTLKEYGIGNGDRLVLV